eukprot:s1881_g8.t1
MGTVVVATVSRRLKEPEKQLHSDPPPVVLEQGQVVQVEKTVLELQEVQRVVESQLEALGKRMRMASERGYSVVAVMTG